MIESFNTAKLNRLLGKEFTLEMADNEHNAQHQHYQKYYPEAAFELILLSGEPAGRLYVSRWETQIRIVDIAVLPQHRGKKIGSHLMSQLLDEAKEHGLEVSIHVEHNNPAMRWYLALGFETVEDKGVYRLMKTRLHETGAVQVACPKA
ncbi:GNAT family N-acetyltransferase [Vibrio sp. SM6]|uniref:GNAT family N-acetyltransferase n=1 Tax=Vibrio agarilyticus TaxID=2726741 RepID=A0A7X8TP32_9VIBR|nr:GNAT family N-acetyltransferase [Vibrio agarilyticus]NLS12184.1 GNAT family N-acetyltransferase [Vibrio agarilyticus]